MPEFAVIGHVEWMQFARFAHVPVAGEIIDGTDGFEEAAGSAAVAAVQIAKLAGGRVRFFTALGADERGARARERLEALGIDVLAAERDAPQRHGFCHLDDDGERTISLVGDRLVPHADDPLPWEALDEVDAVFVSGGDAGAMQAARRAHLVVATPRAGEAVAAARVRLDALVGSAEDRLEKLSDGTLDPPPAVEVRTRGGHGGTWRRPGGESGTWKSAALLGPRVDAYGAGDSFAGGFTYGIGAGLGLDGAIELAARCGAANLTGRGPYAGQLTQA